MKADLTHVTFSVEIRDAEKVKSWLLSHEHDISLGMADYGEMKGLFRSVIKRDPAEINVSFPYKE